MERLLEAALIVLLAATLLHAVRLQRGLASLRGDRAALESLVATLQVSARQAEDGIARLRETSEGTGVRLAHQIEAAQELEGDLRFLIERGNQMADRLERDLRPRRTAPSSPSGPERQFEPDATDAPTNERGRSRAERELMVALRRAR